MNQDIVLFNTQNSIVFLKIQLFFFIEGKGDDNFLDVKLKQGHCTISTWDSVLFKKSNLLFFIEGKGDDNLLNFKLNPTPISLSFTQLAVTSMKNI